MYQGNFRYGLLWDTVGGNVNTRQTVWNHLKQLCRNPRPATLCFCFCYRVSLMTVD